MFYFKICLVCVVLTICKAEAEKDIAGLSTISYAVALQLSESKQLQKHLDNPVENMSSDVEVFNVNDGPSKGKQEEEQPAGEKDNPSNDEGTKSDEMVAGAEPDSVTEAEEAGEAPPQTDDETATEDANNENATAAEEEKETTQSDDVANANGEAAANDEAEMPNDEPHKGEETEKPVIVHTKDIIEEKEMFCFACSSNEDVKCAIKAAKEIKCPKVNEGDAGKHNGCYTLYQADTNTTMRGCVDDLAEAGLKYCLKNERLCKLCYSNGCNDKLAPSTATKLQLNHHVLVILNISALLLISSANLKFDKF